MNTNKRKIINDPVYGFISLKSDLVFDLIEHPYFQRLRRIRQLGLSCLVYPGANHTRFEHAIGATHLMRSAIDVLKSKEIEITDEEAEAVTIAILLHDIGHGPFSHALENTIVSGVSHEYFSLMLMEDLNRQFSGKLSLAIQIFKNEYHKKFLHQLVASQLDLDRLDYLRRDSFYSGVIEGTIGSDRIIKMMNVVDDNLVVDKKGIYSIEKFLIARRLMYWQVYLHKTVLAAEYMLIHVLNRVKELTSAGNEFFAPPNLQFFLKENISKRDFENRERRDEILRNFVLLDDTDILSSIKQWSFTDDKVLAYLSNAIINRKLLKIKIGNSPMAETKFEKIKSKVISQFNIDESSAEYLTFQGDISNSTYIANAENIFISNAKNKIKDIENASDINLHALTKNVKKHFTCYPKELEIN